jgi:hypothetical protein
VVVEKVGYCVGYIFMINQIWGYVNRCNYLSLVALVYWGCVRKNVPMCLRGGPFLRYELSPLFSLLCCMCV